MHTDICNMKKATFDNFNAYIQREYDYLYNCIDIMRKTASHEEDSERLKSDIEEAVVIHTDRIESVVLRMLDDVSQCEFVDNGPINSYKNEEYVYIPTGNKKIENYAFANNKNVKVLEIPEWVSEIGEHAFEGCENLKSIILPKSLTKIERYAFCDCVSLESIVVPDSVTDIGYGAFSGCASLKEITLPFVGRAIKPEEQRWCVFGNIFGDYVRDGYMHRDTLIYTTSDGSGYTSQNIQDDAPDHFFHYAIPQSLRRVVITKQEIIPDSAFKNCDLIEEIILPDNVQEVSDNAFEGCDSLNTLSPMWVDIRLADRGEYGDFEIKNNRLVKYKGNATHVRIPYGVTKIGPKAFYNCTKLKSVIIPGSVTHIFGGAFSGCQSLTGIVIPDSVKSIQHYYDDYSYNSSNATFYDCKSLKKIVLKGLDKEKLLKLRNILLQIDNSFNKIISFET